MCQMALWQVVRASCGKVAGRNSPLWKGSGNNLLRRHFSSTSEFALRRLPCWQEMLLTKRNSHHPSEWEDRGICFQIKSSLLLLCLLPSLLFSQLIGILKALYLEQQKRTKQDTLTTPSSSSFYLLAFTAKLFERTSHSLLSTVQSGFCPFAKKPKLQSPQSLWPLLWPEPLKSSLSLLLCTIWHHLSFLRVLFCLPLLRVPLLYMLEASPPPKMLRLSMIFGLVCGPFFICLCLDSP